MDYPHAVPCALYRWGHPVRDLLPALDIQFEAPADTVQTIGMATVPETPGVSPEPRMGPCRLNRGAIIGWKPHRKPPAGNRRGASVVPLCFDTVGLRPRNRAIRQILRRMLLFSLRCAICREAVSREDQSGAGRVH